MVGIERIAAYIDGFNFYYGLKAKGWGNARWLDYRTLVRRFVLEDQDLVFVKYFTSLMNHEPEKFRRQSEYLRALEHHGGLEIVQGEYETRKVKCKNCGQWYSRPQEKKTDVNIATHLVADALRDRFDRFILICADSDLVPAVQLVVDECSKGMILIDPPRRHSDDLRRLADVKLHIARSRLNQSQLPDPVQYLNKRGKVKTIRRPESWS